MDNVIESGSFRLAESNGQLTLTPRGELWLVGLGALAILVGALSYLQSRWPLLGPSASVPQGVDYVVMAAGAILVVVGVLTCVRRKVVFDSNLGSMTIGSRTYPFLSITELRLSTLTFGTRQRFTLVVMVDGKERQLVSGSEEVPMRKLVEHLHKRIVLRPASLSQKAVVDVTPRELAAGKYFASGILLGIGAVWSAGWYYFFPDLIFVHRTSAQHGPLVWALGLWIIALGLCELTGIPVWRWLRNGPLWRRSALGLVFISTYFYVFWR